MQVDRVNYTLFSDTPYNYLCSHKAFSLHRRHHHDNSAAVCSKVVYLLFAFASVVLGRCFVLNSMIDLCLSMISMKKAELGALFKPNYCLLPVGFCH